MTLIGWGKQMYLKYCDDSFNGTMRK